MTNSVKAHASPFSFVPYKEKDGEASNESEDDDGGIDDDEFDDNFNDEKIELDEDELISFLNEYYTVNPHLIPKGETF